LLRCTLVGIGTLRHFAATQQTVAFGGKADMHLAEAVPVAHRSGSNLPPTSFAIGTDNQAFFGLADQITARRKSTFVNPETSRPRWRLSPRASGHSKQQMN
jgi:hypothetical protein